MRASTVCGVGSRCPEDACACGSPSARATSCQCGAPEDSELLYLVGKRNGSAYPGARALRGLHDLGRACVQHPVIKGLEPDADVPAAVSLLRSQSRNWRGGLVHPRHLCARYSMILVTTPAPTVRPPSRMAKRRFSSMAIGTMRFTVNETLSPGMTISMFGGSSTEPVTSVVRK